MAGESKITTDHEEIKKWAEQRGGHPATVEGTGGDGAGVLRINFPDVGGGKLLKDISWEEFFDKFDEKELAFLYQDKTSAGALSRFSKFISRKSLKR